MKRSLFLAICLILFLSLTADIFDELEARKECDKWVQEGGSYLMWAKDWKQVDGVVAKEMEKTSCIKWDNWEETSINN